MPNTSDKYRIAFCPWKKDEKGGPDALVQLKGFMKYARRTVAVAYSGASDPLIEGLPATGTVYVQGHGHSSCKSISPTSTSGKELSAKDVSDRLVASGLQQAFQGKVKLWVCHSGEKDTFLSSLLWPAPFAKHVAKVLLKRGYQCQVYGYKGSVYIERPCQASCKLTHINGKDYAARDHKILFTPEGGADGKPIAVYGKSVADE